MTARTLLAALESAGCSPAVSGGCLTFAADPPAGLEPALGILHTGVRALLAGLRWFGCQSDGRPVVLSPDKPIPAGVGLCAVELDSGWDRLSAADRSELRAALFDDVSLTPPNNRRQAKSVTSGNEVLS